jgi:hypothetical protein
MTGMASTTSKDSIGKLITSSVLRRNLKIHHNDKHREIFEHIVYHQSYDDFDHEDEIPSKSDCENISEAGMVRARRLIDK